MIRYDRLWATMQAQGMTQYRLIKHYNFSAGQIGRLKKNMHVSTHTLDTLCTLLGCDISDIIEYIPEGQPAPEEQPVSEVASAEKEASSKSRKSDSPKGDKPKKSEPKNPRNQKRAIKRRPRKEKRGKRGRKARRTSKHSAISTDGAEIFNHFTPSVIYFPPFCEIVGFTFPTQMLKLSYEKCGAAKKYV